MKPLTIDLTARTAIVTGGTSGIGLSIARALGRAGAKVVIVGRNADRGAKAQAGLAEEGIDAMFLPGDLEDENAMGAVLELACEKLGKLNILVNNAARIHPEMYQPFRSIPWDELQRSLAVNYLGALFCCRKLMPWLDAVGGNIINVSSVGGTESFSNATAYCPTKAALDHFTRCLALESGPFGVRVNAIAPGYTDTPGVSFATADAATTEKVCREKIPVGRLGHTDEVGVVAAFLASDLASYMTGSVVVVDGGWLLK